MLHCVVCIWGHVTKIWLCTCLEDWEPSCFFFIVFFRFTQFASWLGFGATRLEFVGECSCRQLRTLAQPPPVSCSSSPTPRSDCQTVRLWQVWICQVLWKCDHSPWVLSPLANTNCCIAPLLFPSHCNAFPTLQSDKHSQFFPPPAALSNVSSDVGWHSPRVSPPRRGTTRMLPYFFPAYLPWSILTSLCNMNSRLTAPYPLKCFGKPQRNWPNNIIANFQIVQTLLFSEQIHWTVAIVSCDFSHV